MAEESETQSGTLRQSVKQLKSSTTPSSHYLVKFECDECISVIKRMNILELPLPLVGDECRMDWNGVEHAAKVLVVGDEATVKRAEDSLKSIDGSCEANEENRPPKKKMRLTQEKLVERQGINSRKGRKGKKAKRRGRKPKDKKTLNLTWGHPQDSQKLEQMANYASPRSQPSGLYHSPVAPSQPDTPPSPTRELSGQSSQPSHPTPPSPCTVAQILPLNPPPAHPAPSREPDCSRSVRSDLSSSSSEHDDVVLTGTFPRKVC